MPVKVVDASALAAILFNEPEADAVAERLEDHRLTAPALIQFEITSVCLKKIRKRPEQRDRLLEALRQMHRLPIKQIQVSTVELVELALATGLTAYDASYLWLARNLGAELVTLDQALARVANRQ